MNRLTTCLFTLSICLTAGAQQVMTLSQCREYALQHNESLKTADNAVRQAELERQIAFTNYLPKLDGSLSGIYMKDIDMMGMKMQLHGTYMAGLSITQPIFAGGQIVAGNRLAAIGKDISEEQRRQTRMQVIADVDNAYYTLIAVDSKVRMLEAYAEQMASLHDQVALSVEGGLSTENEMLRVVTKQTEIDYQLQKARNGQQLCQLALANVIGASIDDEIVAADTLLTLLPPLDLSEDISLRPEVRLLEYQVGVSEQQVKMARANYLPTIGLSLGYTYYDNMKLKGVAQAADGNYYPYTTTFHDDIPMAALSVSVPIFHWGAEVKKVKKAKLDVENARYALEQNSRAMKIEVRQAVQNLTDGYRMVETARIGQEQATENLRVMRQKYENQMATMTDLLDAQSQWQQARSNHIEAQTQYKIYETEYLRVTGRLDN